MTAEHPSDEDITDAINQVTERVSNVMLKEFLTLPDELQLNVVLIKSAQLLLANVLCQIAADKTELEQLLHDQENEFKELTQTCAHSGFADKFDGQKH